MRQLRRHLGARGTPEVDVTAFLSLMVILVPFLMITAVFSRMTILELEAAADTAGDPRPAPGAHALIHAIVQSWPSK